MSCTAPETGAELISSTIELLRSTSRSLIFVTSGIYLAWYIAVEASDPEGLNLGFFFIAVATALICVLSLWLLPKSFLTAQVVWQIGLIGIITSIGHVSQQSEVTFFYALLPMIAAVTVNWRVGLLMEGLVIVLVWWLSHSSVMPHLSTTQGLVIIIGGALTGLLGWIVTHSLLTVTQWSLSSFEQARGKIEEAREQRMELKQTQEDLVLANRELSRLLDRLKAMQQVVEEARRAKDEFATNVSHELRTPLNMIIGFTEMMTQSPQIYGHDLPSSLLADIDVIQRNSRQLARLVDDVLDLSQLEVNRMALSKEWVSLCDIVDEAAVAVRPLFESRGLYLESEIPADLPPVFCDSTRIRQVMLNLVNNAARFTEEGGVRIEAWCEGDTVVVSVTDTGPGIAPEDQARLFEPFQQLDASIRRRHGGSGLGLNISKQFVEMHRGRMWFESEVGAGATFYFNLPLRTPPPTTVADDGVKRWFSPYSEYEYRTRTRSSKAPEVETPPRFVLLEEGDTLQELFASYWDNVEIITVQDSEAAMHELNHSPAQALVVNASPFEEMPISPSQLTNLPYDTPAVTCWVPGEDDAAKHLGVLRYLVKPIARKTLLSTLEGLGESVLVVDDDPEALQLFVRMLSTAQHEYRILQAPSGQRALNLLRERQPDVMLLDLIMPGMDGFEVLRQKSLDPAIREIPVVVITSRDPANKPIMSNALTVTRGGGWSVPSLLTCIQAISEILCPSVQRTGQGQPGRPGE